ncbi:mitochondrial dicarboxylate carrier [Drosophila grimshawi]|uniref:mitochondrial dicarboxylate carrier n=1 Tax=Drosophila grimshawi TaxID=7222 RepID=UPI000C86FCED|nr:mitochondrial dicarboxylate carrier [Drosophila grimshawi]
MGPSQVAKSHARINSWWNSKIRNVSLPDDILEAWSVQWQLDLIKVLIQTQKEKISLAEATRKIIREQVILALYDGISASLLRQYTYTLNRFGFYTAGVKIVDTTTMTNKMLLVAFGGGIGGLVGAPADLLNVRLQNDVKFPPKKRRK